MSKSSISGTCSAILCLALSISFVEAKHQSRIADGETANIGEFPWQAAILFNNDFLCGAAIIDERHLLTAAHCAYGRTGAVNNFSLAIGSNVIDSGEKYDVESIIVHPGFYKIFPFTDDIAVMKLATKIDFNENKSVVALPASDVPVNASVALSGWGRDAWGDRPKGLAKLNLKIMTNTDCDVAKIDTSDYYFTDGLYVTPLTSGHVCGMAEEYSGTCTGDSGGAVVYNASVIGIVSWKYRCGDRYPNVFTRVYKYVNWIQEAMKL